MIAVRNPAAPDPVVIDETTVHVPIGTSMAEVERAMIVATLQQCRGNKTKAAAMLGLSLKTIYNKLNAIRALEMLS